MEDGAFQPELELCVGWGRGVLDTWRREEGIWHRSPGLRDGRQGRGAYSKGTMSRLF